MLENGFSLATELFECTHLIPEGDNLFVLERFETFIKAREALIRKRLRSISSDS
jgi:hypothetical protein